MLRRKTAPVEERTVSEVDVLVERLMREVKTLDEDAIEAIVEVTGASREEVGVAVARRGETSVVKSARNNLLGLDPKVRRIVTAGWFAGVGAIFHAVGATFGDRSFAFGLTLMLSLIGAMATAIASHRPKDAALAGVVAGFTYVFFYSFSLALIDIVWQIPAGLGPFVSLLLIVAGGLIPLILHGPTRKIGKKLGVRSDREDRMEMLKQLVDLQDRLKTNQQEVAFISVDMVGSASIKAGVDQLQVEFTFSEFHRFIESVVARNGGSIHSTAGDGVTAVFESVDFAFRAGKQIQSGLFEFNTARNRLGRPVELRVGIDHGAIVPEGTSLQEVSFSDVIDGAAHVQKLGVPRCVTLSERAVKMMKEFTGSLETLPETVHGQPLRIWRPASELKVIGANATPPSMPTQPSAGS